MAKIYENEFKVMIVELLNSGRSIKEISDEYQLNDSMLRRWRREFETRAGDFAKKRELSPLEIEVKALRKENIVFAFINLYFSRLSWKRCLWPFLISQHLV